MSLYEILSLILEGYIYISVMLTVEYFWGRSDMDMKNEARKKRKFKEKYSFERLCVGEHQ